MNTDDLHLWRSLDDSRVSGRHHGESVRGPYVRTCRGQTVHLLGCWHLRRARQWPWNWADGMTVAEIEAALLVEALGPYLFCRDCFGPEYEGEGGHRPSRRQVNARIREIKAAVYSGGSGTSK